VGGETGTTWIKLKSRVSYPPHWSKSRSESRKNPGLKYVVGASGPESPRRECIDSAQSGVFIRRESKNFMAKKMKKNGGEAKNPGLSKKTKRIQEEKERVKERKTLLSSLSQKGWFLVHARECGEWGIEPSDPWSQGKQAVWGERRRDQRKGDGER